MIAFFLLYVTEGIPLGFAATAVATRLRRLDVGPAEIGAFVASFYLPWAFKWAFGPLVDVFPSDRWGRRRAWILGTQVLMALTLLSTVLLDLPRQLGLFTLILLVHNSFGAMQDVAIDALACSTLQDDERGLANGMMFAGASIGSMVGGAGVLYLSAVTGFQPTFYFVAACILLVTAFVVLPMKEAPSAIRTTAAGSRLRQAGLEMQAFAVDSFRSFLGSPGAFGGLLFALLPAGAMCLGLALQSNLAISYSATWQGIAIEAWGYPHTMLVDGIFGLACLLVLPWLKRTDAASAWPLRYGAWLAPALLLYARYYLDTLARWLPQGFSPTTFVANAQALMLAIAISAGAVLLWLGSQSWQAMQVGRATPD